MMKFGLVYVVANYPDVGRALAQHWLDILAHCWAKAQPTRVF
jgi:hypothetical protein